MNSIKQIEAGYTKSIRKNIEFHTLLSEIEYEIEQLIDKDNIDKEELIELKNKINQKLLKG
ncbi:MAG: hypothetical protein WCS33_00020 [Candidatus Caldatribacteriota bacterium]